MPEVTKGTRMAKVAKEINLGIETIAEHLRKKGFEVDAKPTTKITGEMYAILKKDFSSDIALKERAEQVTIGHKNRERLELDDDGSIQAVKPSDIPQVVADATPPVTEKEEVVKSEETVELDKTEQTAVDELVKEVTTAQTTAPVVEAKPPTPTPAIVEDAIPEEKIPEKKVVEAVEEKPIVEPKPVVPNVVEAKTETPKEVATPKEEKVVEPPVVEKTRVEIVEAKVEAPVEVPPVPKVDTPEENKIENIKTADLDGPKVIGKINLSDIEKPSRKKQGKKVNKNIAAKGKVGGLERPARKKEKTGRRKPDRPITKKAIETKKPASNKPPVAEATPKNTVKKPEVIEIHKRVVPKLEGPKVLGKIELPVETDKKDKKKKRRRIQRPTTKKPRTGTGNQQGNNNNRSTSSGNNNNNTGNRSGGGNRSNNTSGGGGNNNNRGGNRSNSGRNDNRGRRRQQGQNIDAKSKEVSEKEIQEKIKATMAKLSGKNNKNDRSKRRKNKRDAAAEKAAAKKEQQLEESKILQVTEFITVKELASLMDSSPTAIIQTCMQLGTFVSINQRLDAELIDLVTEEFGFQVQFIDVSDDEEVDDFVDEPENLKDRAPIVTIMGHVDHGKTSLLDYIRSANVIAGEVGGITQHIGAYEVTTDSGKQITFLDTPGHEAFTAMRARGAKITDIAVIVIAADDAVMPQTKEAISHAQAAGVPIIFAFNKIDRPNANPEKIKDQLAQMNMLVEDWGGKYQSEEISAKFGKNIDGLLEKILLEAELLELKANPDRESVGSVIEASLDKGRGYVTTVLVQTGTLKIGDMVVAGSNYGKVKAMFDERGMRVDVAGPATPVLILGLNGAPQAGEKFKVYTSEQEAKELAVRREQIMREQGRRTKKHITLDEIGRRLALESFKELNLIVKGDVDGSVEALADSLLKLSTEEIQVNVIHKSVGQISESDVLLATASDAIIIGFQVRPSLNARQLAEKEDIDIRLYSIIYDAIEEIKSAMEGMLEPTIEEKIVANVEIREVFKITRVGTVAGCVVQDGKITRNTKIRLVREGIVKYSGELSSLKRFKDDVKEVTSGMECGMTIKNYNDLKVGDIIEGYEEIEIKRTLS